MNVASRFEALLEQKAPNRCSVARILRKLDAEEPNAANMLRRVLENSSISTRAIKRELDEAGHHTARESIANHRHGFCACKDEQ